MTSFLIVHISVAFLASKSYHWEKKNNLVKSLRSSEFNEYEDVQRIPCFSFTQFSFT